MAKSSSFFSKRVSLFREYYSRQLISYTYSRANFLSILIWFLIIVMPLIAITQTGELWSKRETYLEQPLVLFNEKSYVQAVMLNDGGPTVSTYDYSTVASGQNAASSLSPPAVKSAPVDSDDDGIIDQYNITLRIRKPAATQTFQQINLILGFDYELQDLVKMKMEGLAVVSIDTLASAALNPGKVMVKGDLKMLQPNPLKELPGARVRTVYYDNFFSRLETLGLEDFLKAYKTERNETLLYDYTSKVHYVQGSADKEFVDVELSLKIPQQEILYRPQFWQVLKLTWVKYFACFIFMYVLLYKFFLSYVMTGGVFDVVQVSEVGKQFQKVFI